MRAKLIIATAALQVLALAYLAGAREWVLRAGRTVYLRTAPVDPRDVMRGDYVRLDYEISRVPFALCRDGLTNAARRAALIRDTRVYAALRVGDDGLAEVVSLSDRRPAEGLFIRGRWDGEFGSQASVRYGVEAYFMEQGEAAKLERGRFQGNAQVPMEMAVAISPGGLAVLKGQRWSPLGLGLELVTVPGPRTDFWDNARPVAAKLTLLNNSRKDLAIVDLPEGRSFALVSDSQWRTNAWRWVHAGEPPPRPDPAQVVVLKPAQTYTSRIDLTSPAWFVIDAAATPSAKAAPKPLREINADWGTRFRFAYRPPDAAACKGLPNADLIWHGSLPSRAFNAGGRVD